MVLFLGFKHQKFGTNDEGAFSWFDPLGCVYGSKKGAVQNGLLDGDPSVKRLTVIRGM